MPRWQGPFPRPPGAKNYYRQLLAVDRAQRERTLTILVAELNEIANPIRAALARLDARRQSEVANG